MMYKEIEWLCGDLTLMWKGVGDYRSVVSAYLSLKKLNFLMPSSDRYRG